MWLLSSGVNELGVVLVALALGCSGSVASSTEDTREPPNGIACGLATCAVGDVCGIGRPGDGEAERRCYARGREPSLPSVLLYCDGDEDCEAGSRCMRSRGEIERFTCSPDGCDSFLNGHVCSTESDCRPCEGFRERLRVACPELANGSRHLRVCQFATQ